MDAFIVARLRSLTDSGASVSKQKEHQQPDWARNALRLRPMRVVEAV